MPRMVGVDGVDDILDPAESSSPGSDDVDDIPAAPTTKSSKATRIESEVEEDVLAKDQLKTNLYEQVEKTSGKKARQEEEDGDDKNEGEYAVEAVVDHKFVRNNLYYLVKWEDYGDEENTWEPPENLLPESRNLVAEYHEKIGGEPQPKSAKRKPRASHAESPANSTPIPKRQKRQSTVKTDQSMNGSPEAEDTYGSWLPKGAKWDDLIEEVETVERDGNGNLRAYIRFKNGKRTKVNQNLYYAHCPKTLLEFYEKHLSV